MTITSETMGGLLVGCIAGMALLAAFYLRRREMSHAAYLAWGLLALLVPLLGPFLVILNHPGKLREGVRSPQRRQFSRACLTVSKVRRIRSWMVRMR